MASSAHHHPLTHTCQPPCPVTLTTPPPCKAPVPGQNGDHLVPRRLMGWNSSPWARGKCCGPTGAGVAPQARAPEDACSQLWQLLGIAVKSGTHSVRRMRLGSAWRPHTGSWCWI